MISTFLKTKLIASCQAPSEAEVEVVEQGNSKVVSIFVGSCLYGKFSVNYRTAKIVRLI